MGINLVALGCHIQRAQMYSPITKFARFMIVFNSIYQLLCIRCIFRSFSVSWCLQVHRRKVRAWQMICILSPFVDKDIMLNVTCSLHVALYVSRICSIKFDNLRMVCQLCFCFSFWLSLLYFAVTDTLL